MARALTTALKNETLAAQQSPVLLAFFDFQSGPVRVWTGVGTLSWGGNSYVGLGYLGTVSPPEESVETRANGLTFQLSGVPNALIATVIGDNYHGRADKLWLGCLDGAGALIADPYQVFSGRMDTLIIDKGGTTSVIRVGAESIFIDLQRSRTRRFTHEDQQIDFPGDRGFEMMATSQSTPLYWGGKKVPSSSGAGNGAETVTQGTYFQD